MKNKKNKWKGRGINEKEEEKMKGKESKWKWRRINGKDRVNENKSE